MPNGVAPVFTRPSPPVTNANTFILSYLGLAAAGLEVLGKDSGVGVGVVSANHDQTVQVKALGHLKYNECKTRYSRQRKDTSWVQEHSYY